MRSYTSQYKAFKQDVKSNDPQTEEFFQRKYMSSLRTRLAGKDWRFLETERTLATTAASRTVKLSADVEILRSLYVLNGSTKYFPRLVVDNQEWTSLTSQTFTSDIPTHFRVINRSIELHPIPASVNTVVINFKKKIVDCLNADYTTGTVSITSGATTVTGSGTTFTSAMVGRHIKTTDGIWYEISAYTSATSITISTPYLGSTISGATYTIGDLTPLPDGYEDLPLFDAESDFYADMKADEQSAGRKMAQAQAIFKQMKEEHMFSTTSGVIDAGMGFRAPRNPNLYVTL